MKTLRILLFLFVAQNITAQSRLSKTEVEALPNTIENQFTKIYRLSNNWQEYKMIKRVHFTSFQKNILDSIATIKKDVVTKQLKITEQQKNTNTLKAEIVTLKNNLATSVEKEDAFSFLGMLLSKATYNTILWSFILSLLVGLAFFIFKFKSSYFVIKETKNALIDVEDELEQYKKKAIDKEQKLRRQLQDEINKQRGVN